MVGAVGDEGQDIRLLNVFMESDLITHPHGPVWLEDFNFGQERKERAHQRLF